jgi:hypothetical protein
MPTATGKARHMTENTNDNSEQPTGDERLPDKIRCVDCNDEMSFEDRMAGLWYIDRWCIDCVKKEDERSLREDTFDGTEITFRKPRYLHPESEWREDTEFTAIDAMMKDLIEKGRKS